MCSGQLPSAVRAGERPAGFVEALEAEDPDVLVPGDLHAYGEENPINALHPGRRLPE